jgi:hypothetical protein
MVMVVILLPAYSKNLRGTVSLISQKTEKQGPFEQKLQIPMHEQEQAMYVGTYIHIALSMSEAFQMLTFLTLGNKAFARTYLGFIC